MHLRFNWLRVWATWGAFDQDVSAVDAQGGPREPFLGKLQCLVAECDRRGLVMDVTLTRGKRSATSLVSGHVLDFPSHKRAVETLVNALKGHRNWYLDLANECDVRDDRYVSTAELKTLRDLARRLDPQRLVTASFGGHDLTEGDVRDYGPYADQDWPNPDQGQAAMIARMDKQIGRLLDHLKTLGLEGRTLVMFSSDNMLWKINEKGVAGGSPSADKYP